MRLRILSSSFALLALASLFLLDGLRGRERATEATIGPQFADGDVRAPADASRGEPGEPPLLVRVSIDAVGSISGTVRAPGGAPLGGVCVETVGAVIDEPTLAFYFYEDPPIASTGSR